MPNKTRIKRIESRRSVQANNKRRTAKSHEARTCTGEDDDPHHIPGFYFDSEKKRYFRIIPGQPNISTSAVSAKINIPKEKECKHVNPSTRKRENSIVSDIFNMQLERNSFRSRRAQMMAKIVQNLSWHNSVHVTLHEYVYDVSRSYLKEIMSSTDESELICQWCLGHDMEARFINGPSDILQRVKLSDSADTGRDLTKLDCASLGYQKSTVEVKGIMSTCMAHIDSFTFSETQPVLYAATVEAPPFAVDTVAIVDPLDGNYFKRRLPSVRTFHVGEKWVWSCAWNPGFNNQFALGTEKLALLFDADTGKRFKLNTQSSDVLSLAYSSASSDLLYAGTRSGAIFCYKSQKKVKCFSQSSSVHALCVTSDGRQLIAADFSGKLVSWDTRQERVLTDYPEHVNSSAASPSVGIDRHDQFVYAVGSDGYTRVWNLQTCELLKTVEPPHPLSCHRLPSVCLSASFGETALPGLIMSVNDELHFYSL